MMDVLQPTMPPRGMATRFSLPPALALGFAHIAAGFFRSLRAALGAY